MTTAAETGAETQDAALSGGPEHVPTNGAEPAAQAASVDAAVDAAEPAVDANGDGAWGVGRLSFDDAEKHASRFKASWEVDDHAAAPGLEPTAPSFSADGGSWAAAGSAAASPASSPAAIAMPAAIAVPASIAVPTAVVASPAATAPVMTPAAARQRATDSDATGQMIALPMSKPSRNPLVWAMGAVVVLLIAGGLWVVFSGSDEAPVATETPAPTTPPDSAGATPATLSVPVSVAPAQAIPQAVVPSMPTQMPTAALPVVSAPVLAPPVAPAAVIAVPVVAPRVVAPRVVAVPAVAPRTAPIAAIPTPPAPETVRVQIRVTPPNATVTFDGMRVRTPYDVRLTKNRTAHRVEATLDGYQTLTQSVELSRDRDVTLTMRPDAPAVVAAPRARPRPRPQAQPRPTKRGAGFVTDNPFD